MSARLLVAALVSTLLAAGTVAGAADSAGQEVFAHYCAACHGTADGPGTMQLARTRGPQRALLAERTDLTAEYIDYVVRHGLKAMPPFAPSDLDAAKLRLLDGFLVKSVKSR
jgi:mono/diheme cytochrome c family protein